MKTFEQVWQRIVDQEGNEFRQVRGKTFTYKLTGNAPFRAQRIISFREAKSKKRGRMPVTGPGALQDLIAPSYLYALLSDPRIDNKKEEPL